MQQTTPVSSTASSQGRSESLNQPLPCGEDCFRSSEQLRPGGRTFGGRLVAEALLSATATVDPLFHPHSVHAQFLRSGDTSKATTYSVERLREGRSVVNRMVRAEQDGELICIVMVSFSLERQGLDRQRQMPQVPSPASLPDEATARKRLSERDALLGGLFWGRDHPVEFRPVDLPSSRQDRDGQLQIWFRAKPQFMPLDQVAGRAALLAYASDRFVMTSSLLPHLNLLATHELTPTSLDHALWIHRDYSPGGWLLYEIESVTTAGSWTFVRGQMFAESGDHIASIGQEGLLRVRPRINPAQQRSEQ